MVGLLQTATQKMTLVIRTFPNCAIIIEMLCLTTSGFEYIGISNSDSLLWIFSR